MARPSRCRRICFEPAYDSFAPCPSAEGGSIILSVDEYEVMRLIDYEKKTQEQCAKQMEVSRTTVTGMYERARFKIADCIVNGKQLQIKGGNYRLRDGASEPCRERSCRKCNCPLPSQLSGMTVKAADQTERNQKGAGMMRVAVTYENGTVFQHFGHTGQFKIYDVTDHEITGAQVVDTMGSGHGALAGFLASHEVDTLICGGIGGGAINALAEAGIRLFGGVSGSADEAVEALLAGNLDDNPSVCCSHHEQGHSCGGHTCKEEKHGCSGNGGVAG